MLRIMFISIFFEVVEKNFKNKILEKRDTNGSETKLTFSSRDNFTFSFFHL